MVTQVSLKQAFIDVFSHINELEVKYGRKPGAVGLLAVSKRQPVGALEQAILAGQRQFGESYAQEAEAKITQIEQNPAMPGDIVWHFIGPLQSNKTRIVAARFDWVHGVDRLKIARRLHEQRPARLPPLNVCIQVNISNEASKSGISVDEVRTLARDLQQLEHIQLRGLMALPAPETDFERQRQAFRAVAELLRELNADGYHLDTLSMGTSRDYEAAIAEGATLIRLGTALFGARK